MRPILFFDTETTGLPDWKEPSDSPQQPHLAQLGMVLADADSRRVLHTINIIVKPEVDQPTWAAGEETHCIPWDLAMAVGAPESFAVSLLMTMWGLCDRRVCHNRTFDQRIIRIALKRYQQALQIGDGGLDNWGEKDDFDCTMLLSKPVLQLPPKGRYGWKNPKLTEAHEALLGYPMADAHDALADARGCMEVYWKLIDGGHVPAFCDQAEPAVL